MPRQIDATAPHRLIVGRAEIGLRNAAIHLQRAHRRNDHGSGGLQPGLAAFDVEELLRAEIRAEPRLGHHIIGQPQSGARRDHRIAAMRNIGERPAMDERRRALQRLDEVGLDRLRQQHRHRAIRLEVARRHRLLAPRIGDDDPPEPCLQIVQIARQAQDRHHFGGDGDVEPALTRETVGRTAKRLRDVSECPVVHVHHAPPHDPPHVDIERIAPMNMVVDHRREQIVRAGDRMEIAGKMEVDVLHRHDLRIAAAGRAALGPEARTQAWFAQSQHRPAPGAVERIGEPYRRGRFAFARRRRVDRCDQDQLALAAWHKEGGEVDLSLEMPIWLDRFGRDPSAGGDGADRLQSCGARDFDIGKHEAL